MSDDTRQEPAAAGPAPTSEEEPAAPRRLESDVARDPLESDGERIRYEVVFDCRDRLLGERLADQLLDLVTSFGDAKLTEDGPTYATTVEFFDASLADGFFRGEEYRQFCVEVRRSSQSSVLVVPLGAVES